MDLQEHFSNLMSVEKRSENVFRVHLPVLYADGENVCIEIIQNPHSFFISDCGFGLENALAQIEDISENDIEKIGKNISKLYGLNVSQKYTTRELKELNLKQDQNKKDIGQVYLKDISIDDLNGAIMLVANASQIFSQKIVAEKILVEEISLKERVEDRLKFIFHDSYNRYVKKDVPIAGQSTKTYNISFVVTGDKDKTRYIEPVSSKLNSISPLYLKYSDISNPGISKESVISNIKLWDAGSLELVKNVSDKLYEVERIAA